MNFKKKKKKYTTVNEEKDDNPTEVTETSTSNKKIIDNKVVYVNDIMNNTEPPVIKDNEIYNKALGYLRKTLGDNATFRKGQYEAIEAVFTNKRSLVVQKTGWGKSLVYFISTRINRDLRKGISVVISPLLVLIDNQIEAAKKVGLKCAAIYSGNKDEHDSIINDMKSNRVDIVFTTPESLFNILRPYLKDIYLGMLIIDEAHCISDWGHDFRMSYRKIVDVLAELKNKDFPVLATTATANNRVIEDLKQQIGPNLHISRGDLYRDNLYIQLINFESKIQRYGWILEHLNELPGTGIIYCLTTRDCDSLANFLKQNNILAESYHSDLDSEICEKNITLFLKNQIKVLVSTIKLGMGYDKPDVSFVIHYQVPKNIVSYYQQIGRAARGIECGYCILLKGGNDFNILEYFVEHSFPKKQVMEEVLECFDNLPWDKQSLSAQGIYKQLNRSSSDIGKALRFLTFDKVLSQEKQSYSLTGKRFVYKKDYYDEITNIRYEEIKQLKGLFETKKCVNKEILAALDDEIPFDCNKCENCLSQKLISTSISERCFELAEDYHNNSYIEIIPKDKYKVKKPGTGQYEYPNRPYWEYRGNYIPVEYNEKEVSVGCALSKYGDEGVGTIVGECKYKNEPYPEEVYVKAESILKTHLRKYNINMITFIPSLNNNLMDEFAEKLAKRCNIQYVKCFTKIKNTSQKNMENYVWQKNNAKENYRLNNNVSVKGKNILLLDDMIDSGYTLTYQAIKLLAEGANCVVPMALADSSVRSIDND